MRLSPFTSLNRFLAVQSFFFGARVGSLRFFSKKTRSNIVMRSKHNDFYDGKSLAPVYFPKTENQKIYFSAVNNPKIPIVLGVGPAGTGKTLFACTAAIEALKMDKIQKIVLTRPIVPVDEEELGFLPGDLKNKMAPWTQPLFDIFLEYYSKMALDLMVKEGVIEISPLAFMRGRTFKKCFIIADEMQNSSPNQMMMLTTRIGTDTRLFITGDLAQKDRAGLNGLMDFIVRSDKCDSLVDQGLVKIVNFGVKDVERSMIVNRVVEMYNPNMMAQQFGVTPSRIENARGNVTLPLESPPEGADLNHRRFELGHEVSQISNFEVDLSEDVTGLVPLQIFKGINRQRCKKSSATEKMKELFFKPDASYPYSYTTDFPLMKNHTVVKNITEVSFLEKTEVSVPQINSTKSCACTKTKPASNDCALIPKEHISENLKQLGDWDIGKLDL